MVGHNDPPRGAAGLLHKCTVVEPHLRITTHFDDKRQGLTLPNRQPLHPPPPCQASPWEEMRSHQTDGHTFAPPHVSFFSYVPPAERPTCASGATLPRQLYPGVHRFIERPLSDSAARTSARILQYLSNKNPLSPFLLDLLSLSKHTVPPPPDFFLPSLLSDFISGKNMKGEGEDGPRDVLCPSVRRSANYSNKRRNWILSSRSRRREKKRTEEWNLLEAYFWGLLRGN